MLKNLVALITGGGGSLGLATAKRLIADGYKVVVMESPTAKNDIIKEKLDNKALLLNGDVTSLNDVEKVMATIKSKFGYLNVLVNCAAVSKCRQTYNSNQQRIANLEEFEENLKVNVVGTYNVINQSIPLFINNKLDEDNLRGVIINTSGFYAYDGQIGQVGLSAAGGAIVSMTLPLCRDLSSVGIRVMTIAPGIMDSTLTSFLPEKVVESLSSVTPNPKRLGTPEEFSHMVKAIIDNKFLNGETIRLDGGLRMYIQ